MHRVASALESIKSMVIFCTLVLVANYFIFSTGFAENDATSIATLEADVAAIMQMSRTTGISPSKSAEFVVAPLGLSGDVQPVLTVVGEEIPGCISTITEKEYRVACPFRKETYIALTADRTAVLAPVWRDIGLASTTTAPGITFLLAFAFISHRRRRILAEQNAALETRNRQLETTTFSLFHDLAGPAADTTFATQMLQEMFTPEQISELGLGDIVTLLDQGSTRQEGILRGLREWAEAGKTAGNTEPTDLGSLVAGLIKLQPYMGEVSTGEGLPVLTINPHTFAQAIDNLIRNGIKYNESATKTVRIYGEGNAIVIEDNGRGFDITQFDRLTQPFQRDSTDAEGSGLGLAIVRQIIESHGFSLSAQSTPGVGSRFMITYGRNQ